MAHFPVVIIGARNSPRLEYFKTNSEIMDALRPTFLDATMLDSSSAQNYVFVTTAEYQQVIYGRILSNPEIGCAISNRFAQEKIAETPNGGLILEDDARINDLALLMNVIGNFLTDHQGERAILSLHDGRDWSRIGLSFRQRNPYLRVFGSTARTVAYALTPAAAKELSAANQNYRYVADWPVTGCKYFVATLGLISHGDTSTISTIDSKNSQRPIAYHYKRRIFIFAGIFYLAHRQVFLNYREFLRDLWIPRVKYYFSETIFRLLTLRYPEE